MNKDILPPIELYRKYLNIASIRFNLTIDQCRDKYGLYTIAQWDELFNEVGTIKDTAIEFFGNLPHEDKKRLSLKYFNRLDWHHLTDEQVEGIYKWEHPQTEEQVKEVDILDNKLAKWVEDGCPPIDLNKYPSLVIKLVSENKRLKEVNKLLVDALNIIFDYTDPFPSDYKGCLDHIRKISKAALKEANLIK